MLCVCMLRTFGRYCITYTEVGRSPYPSFPPLSTATPPHSSHVTKTHTLPWTPLIFPQQCTVTQSKFVDEFRMANRRPK